MEGEDLARQLQEVREQLTWTRNRLREVYQEKRELWEETGRLYSAIFALEEELQRAWKQLQSHPSTAAPCGGTQSVPSELTSADPEPSGGKLAQ